MENQRVMLLLLLTFLLKNVPPAHSFTSCVVLVGAILCYWLLVHNMDMAILCTLVLLFCLVHLMNLWCKDNAGPKLLKSWRIILLLSLYSPLLVDCQIVQRIFLFEILLVVVGHPSIRAGLKILNCVSGLDRFNANIVFLQKKIKMFLLGR